MDFKTYFMALPINEREKFAKRCGTSRAHLTNVAYGKKCAALLAIAIERESRGAVRCETLVPEGDWKVIRGTAPARMRKVA